MPQFSYRARNAKGALVEGVLDCPDRSVAIRQIERLHYIPVRIDIVGGDAPAAKQSSNGVATATPPSARTPPPARTPSARPGGLIAARTPPADTQKLKIPHGQLLVFTEQLAHLLKAGMTLDEALSILKKRLKQPKVTQMTQALHQGLIDGLSFSQTLRDFPRVFPTIYVNLVAAGEASGTLP